MSRKQIRFVMVGGFLGSGKTTALLRLAGMYAARGLRVGIITNDQAEGLVDTMAFRAAGYATEEIPEGCFCCHFDRLLEASGRLADGVEPDVILAEPVGSCTDLVNAVIRPLQQVYAGRFSVAPYAVLADPERLLESLDAAGPMGLSRKVTYLYKMQQNEADLIAINKTDGIDPDRLARVIELVERNFPGAGYLPISARTGAGFEAFAAWLDAPAERAGRRPAEVDYARYTEAETALGWLNARVRLSAARAWDGDAFLRRFAEELQGALCRAGGEIGHFKARLVAERGAEGAIHATRNATGPEVALRLDAPLARGALVVNLRAEAHPETLRAAMEGALDRLGGEFGLKIEVLQGEAFAPSPPVPPPASRLAPPNAI
ncbi:MAG: cobalamin biosynthesis protein P47K [Candidatus Hydrogenedentes bacterium]|nr:cobalamin biosynthesis protein P47K [Candidatus Hydrogenedentota bacterium]